MSTTCDGSDAVVSLECAVARLGSSVQIEDKGIAFNAVASTQLRERIADLLRLSMHPSSNTDGSSSTDQGSSVEDTPSDSTRAATKTTREDSEDSDNIPCPTTTRVSNPAITPPPHVRPPPGLEPELSHHSYSTARRDGQSAPDDAPSGDYEQADRQRLGSLREAIRAKGRMIQQDMRSSKGNGKCQSVGVRPLSTNPNSIAPRSAAVLSTPAPPSAHDSCPFLPPGRIAAGPLSTSPPPAPSASPLSTSPSILSSNPGPADLPTLLKTRSQGRGPGGKRSAVDAASRAAEPLLMSSTYGEQTRMILGTRVA